MQEDETLVQRPSEEGPGGLDLADSTESEHVEDVKQQQ